MTHFVQLHLLTTYPPSNPNRDDMGRPKTATYGGVHRLRLSSQSIKRAARLSPAMAEALKGNMGVRTRRLGDEVLKHLREKGANEAKAQEIAKEVAEVFGKIDKAKSSQDQVRIKQLAFISPEERHAAKKIAESLLEASKQGGNKQTKEDIKKHKDRLKKEIFCTADSAVDISMFGRMLADSPRFNREAAIQVSHAITTHRAEVEDDFYTAVDDLRKPAEDEDAGTGFVGEAGFGSGVYYLYICIDTSLLLSNLGDDKELAKKAMEAAAESFATASPSGKCNSFAHHTRAWYICAEAGAQQPRSLASAFLKPVSGEKLMEESIRRLRKTSESIDNAYGSCADSRTEMNVVDESGTLEDIKKFVAAQIENA